jgi:hypothetical protein
MEGIGPLFIFPLNQDYVYFLGTSNNVHLYDIANGAYSLL